MIEIAARLNAKGSFTPEGFSPIENKSIRVVNLSARDSIREVSFWGSSSPENFGL
jgi:hypothetical protein